MSAEQLITKHLDIWTSAHKTRSSAGRGSSNKLDLYGIKKLRELILELAVRGKLVPQDPNDEPAIKLLERISERLNLKNNEDNSPASMQLNESDGDSFSLPSGWVSVRLGSICTIERGGSPRPIQDFLTNDPDGINWIKIGDSDIGGKYITSTSEKIRKEGLSKSRMVYPGDFLLTNSMSFGRPYITKIEGCIHDGWLRISPPIELDKDFLYQILSSNFIFSAFKKAASGAVVLNLNADKVRGVYLPIPPLEEQKRIVAKVDELMAFCDELEQAQTDNIAAHAQLVEALLTTLTNSKDNQELQANWQRIAEHFDTLFTTEDSIDQLKQTILQLAVMGKLVPQDPNDEPASELLKKIAAEKAQLIKEGKIKKDKPLPEITENKKKFEIPKGWELTYLQNVCSLITDGTHQTPKYTNDGRPFISAQCVKPFRFMPENCRYVSEEHYQNYIKNRKPEYGDVLLSRVGAGIGEACVINLNMDFAIYVSTALIKPIFLMPEFLTLWLNSPAGRVFSAENTLGKGVSQGNLNLSLIRAFKIPVPPIEEQKRIIAKIDELINLCDKLIDDIKYGKYIQFFLADALASDSIVF